METYCFQRLDRVRAFLREHAKEEDGEVVNGRGERAGHEGQCLSTCAQVQYTLRVWNDMCGLTVPTRTSLEGSSA